MGTTTAAEAAVPIPLPAPPLADGVVALRPFGPHDVDGLLALWRDPEVARWTGVPPSCDERLAAAWVAGRERRRLGGRGLDLVITEAGGAGALAGAVSLDDPDPEARTAGMGFSLLAVHRGRGLAARAVDLLAGWTLEHLPVDRLHIEIDRANDASRRVAERAGFTPDAAAPARFARSLRR